VLENRFRPPSEVCARALVRNGGGRIGGRRRGYRPDLSHHGPPVPAPAAPIGAALVVRAGPSLPVRQVVSQPDHCPEGVRSQVSPGQPAI
jgi:hypothetical protein